MYIYIYITGIYIINGSNIHQINIQPNPTSTPKPIIIQYYTRNIHIISYSNTSSIINYFKKNTYYNPHQSTTIPTQKSSRQRHTKSIQVSSARRFPHAPPPSDRNSASATPGAASNASAPVQPEQLPKSPTKKR